jgi:hypothetical protein
MDVGLPFFVFTVSSTLETVKANVLTRLTFSQVWRPLAKERAARLTLKTLPYPKPDQLALLFERAVVKEGGGPGPVSAIASATVSPRWPPVGLYGVLSDAVAGVILGILGAAWARQFLRNLLFGIGPDDAVTFLTVLLSVAVAACAIPAWRATRVDPATALRSE